MIKRKAADPRPVALATATTKAKSPQAMASSAAAQTRATLPSVVLVIPRSSKIRASTGNAVILTDIPTNKAKGAKRAPGPASWRYKKYALTTPRR